MTTTLKHRLTIFTVLTVVVYQLWAPLSVLAFEPPTPPTPPSAPSAPTPPSAPTAPTAPGNPTDPSPTPEPTQQPSPTPKSTPSPTPAVSPSPSPTTSPAASSSPTPTPTQSPTPSSSPTSSTGSGVGNSDLTTGDSTTTVAVGTVANTNTSTAPSNQTGSVDLTNSGNGSGSTNSTDLTNTTNAVTVQTNVADIDNVVIGDATTGNNSNSNNTGGNTSTTTGNANVGATIVTVANTNTEGIVANEFNIVDDYTGDIILDVNNPCGGSGCQAGEVIYLTNADNGSDSTNSASVNDNSTTATFQSNDADIDNVIVLEANSGNNSSSGNTGGETTLTTGDANVSANVTNFVNNNISGGVVLNTVNVYGDLVGDIILPEESLCGGSCDSSTSATNSGNGSDSTNTATVSTSDDAVTFQSNDATIANAVILDAQTGDNTADKNTGGDSTINSGDSNLDVNVVNVANQNVSGDWWIVLVNQAGSWIGMIMGAPEDASMAGSEGTQFVVNPDGSITVLNEGNGSDSTNTASSTSTNSDTTVQTNTASVNNTLALSANTGGNTADKNTGGNTNIVTGDANIIANVVNFVNNNISGSGRVVITVVNVFGSWIGNFVGPNQTPVASATPEPEAIGGPEGEIVTAKTQDSQPQATPTPKVLTTTTTTTTTQNQADEGNPIETRRILRSRTLTRSSVLGQADDSQPEAGEQATAETSETQSQTEGPKTIKITWPALITTMLGFAYAVVRSRGMWA